MNNGRGSRILPILAAGLIMVALAVILTIVILRIPDNRKFEESILSVELALNDESYNLVKKELLRASRHAVSSDNWRTLLKLSAASLPENPSENDYNLFTVLAGRASSSLPGLDEFSAYLTWGLLRSGDTKKAAEYLELIRDDKWSSLRTEIKLKTAVGDSEEDVQNFIKGIEDGTDPEFLSHAALLTDSAELTFDAALLYMLNGNPAKAYVLAGILMDKKRHWSSEETISKRGVETALAEIAYDAGEKNNAMEWLSRRIDDTSRRRSVSWESLQFLGDLYWDRYLLQGSPSDLKNAGRFWDDSMSIILPDRNNLPEDSWRLWVNLAVQKESSGDSRGSREILTEALVLFPGRSEVKSAWARARSEDEPALARRLIRTSMSGQSDPVLEITGMEIDPEAITPRLYEARLWNLFEAVTSDDQSIQSVDGRILTTFLLDYMISRKNFSSVDVAIDRYLKLFPDEKWILSWRLAADADRGMALIDLIPPMQGSSAPYDDFRIMAVAENSWRAIHDSALFSIMASDEISELLKHYPHVINASGDFDPEIAEAIILNYLKPFSALPQFTGTPFEDRMDKLLKNRSDLTNSEYIKGDTARRNAGMALQALSSSLLRTSLDDLSNIDKLNINLADRDRAALLYLEAVILNRMGRIDESENRAREVLDLTADHPAVRELLLNEVSF